MRLIWRIAASICAVAIAFTVLIAGLNAAGYKPNMVLTNIVGLAVFFFVWRLTARAKSTD